MSEQENPLLERVRTGLDWPDWSGWRSDREPPQVNLTAIDHAERRAEVEQRLSKARLVADGGPYLERFEAEATSRLAAEADTAVGPLGHYTFAIKDLVAVAGKPVSAGSAVRADAPAEMRTAPIVKRLEALGAVATGRVTLHEFAFGVTGVNDHAGTAPNPKAPGRVPGGSSSGSACAVADGSARVAIGTDTGGSVRIPASFCGVVGYKPSFGLYPAAGVFPLSVSLDHVGLFASSVADVAEVHTALGFDAAAAALPGRVGVARSDIDAADNEVRDAIERAIQHLKDAGAEIIDVRWPDPEETFVTSTAIMFSEAAASHAAALATHGDRYGADIKARLQLGADLSGIEVASAHRLRRALIAQVRSTLADVDVIVSPTTPLVAPLLAEAADPAVAPRIVANTRLGNVVGLPAISVPVRADGPPIGLQVMGASDAELLGAAAAIESIAGGTT